MVSPAIAPLAVSRLGQRNGASACRIHQSNARRRARKARVGAWSARMYRLAGVFIALAILCGSSASAQEKNVMVFAAASLKNSLDDIDVAFTVKNSFKEIARYAACSVRLKQIGQ